MRKAQISVEFLFAVGTIMFFVVALIVVVGVHKDRVLDSSDRLSQQATCQLLSTAISLAFANPGSTINLTINHNATVKPHIQVIELDNAVCTLPTNRGSKASLDEGDVIITSTKNGVSIANA